jgi:cystathionine beta-lyase
MLDQPNTTDLGGFGSLKWTYFEEDVLAAWVAEMDFGLAPSITAALHDAVDALSEGAPFGAGGEGHARLNFATSPSILTEIVERIGAAL